MIFCATYNWIILWRLIGCYLSTGCSSSQWRKMTIWLPVWHFRRIRQGAEDLFPKKTLQCTENANPVSHRRKRSELLALPTAAHLFSSSKDSCYVMPRRLCYIIQKLYHLLKLLGQRKRLQTRVWLALLNWTDYCPQVNTPPFCHSGYLKRPQLHPAAIPNMYLTNTILWSISHGYQQMQLKSHFLFSYW